MLTRSCSRNSRDFRVVIRAPLILAYYIRTDIGRKKRNQPFHHFQVAHPWSLPAGRGSVLKCYPSIASTNQDFNDRYRQKQNTVGGSAGDSTLGWHQGGRPSGSASFSANHNHHRGRAD